MEVVMSNFEGLYDRCANGSPLVSVHLLIDHIIRENGDIDRVN